MAMRIAVIGKRNCLFWDCHVVEALQQLGCQTLHLQINRRPWHLQVVRGVTRTLVNRRLAAALTDRRHAQWMAARVRRFQPDALFFTSAFFIPPAYYEELRDCAPKATLAAWDGDGHCQHEKFRALANLIDVLFETDKTYVAENKLGFRKIAHLQFGATPTYHFDEHVARAPQFYFCGSWTPDRDQLFAQLQPYPMYYRGRHWRHLRCRGPQTRVRCGTVHIREQSKDYNRSLAALNVHQAINHVGALNMRTFEAPACGALLLNDERGEIDGCYERGHEALIYGSAAELRAHMDRVLAEPDYAARIAAAGRRRTTNEHLYTHRMRRALDFLT